MTDFTDEPAGQGRYALETLETARDDRNRVPFALIFAHEHGTGLEAPLRRRSLAASEAIQKLCRSRIEPTERLLLDVPAQEARHQILGESQRR